MFLGIADISKLLRFNSFFSSSGPTDLWYSGISGFGGNGGERETRCVIDGSFRREAWRTVPSAGSGCLQRQFNLTQRPPDTTVIANVLRIPSSSFDDFEIALRINLHDTIHCLIGGKIRKWMTCTFLVLVMLNLRMRTRGHFFTFTKSNRPFFVFNCTRYNLCCIFAIKKNSVKKSNRGVVNSLKTWHKNS